MDMISPSKIGWGTYDVYEGPYYGGNAKFKAATPDSPFHYKVMDVITATEGGAWNAINGYDSCQWTVGLIQMCEGHGIFGVSNMLGAMHAAGVDLSPITDLIDAEVASTEPFRLVPRTGGKLSQGQQNRLMYFGSTKLGNKGSWSAADKVYPKKVAAAYASVFAQPDAIEVQSEFVRSFLQKFQTKSVVNTIFGTSEDENPEGINVLYAMRAGFYSFSANNPALAERTFVRYAKGAGPQDFRNQAWVAAALSQHAYNGFAIYPDRYRKIVPRLNAIFGLSLPTYPVAVAVVSGGPVDGGKLSTVKEIQAALIHLGYDLGPKGADGSYGSKTKAAVVAFQHKFALTADGVIGPKTRAAMLLALEGQG